MRVHAVALLVLVTACSGHGGSRSLGAPSPPGTTAPAGPTTSATGPGATASSPAGPSSSSRPSPTPAPGSSRAGSPVTSPSRRAAPRATATSAPVGTTVAVSQVTGDRFAPSSLALHVGDSVLVTDRDAVAPHTFTITALHVDSGGMNDGQTFRYRFTSRGTFGFVCTYHQDVGMTGTVTVR